ncbi:MAG: serine protease [bacterium]|nr:serine protease [bacterium]
MEHLTKAQIVLLTLFVSFVASMATGIVVVTLMQQAPGAVNQTITNVVERTIEKITPTFVDKPGATVVIKDEDLIVSAVEENSKSTVALKYIGAEGNRVAMGVGTVVSTDGLIITDKKNFDNGLLSATINGAIYTVDIVKSGDDSPLVLGRLMPVASTTPAVFIPVTFGNPGALKVGQTALTLGGRDAKTVASGIITSLDTHTTTDKETKVETTILDGVVLSQRLGGISNGAPIITLDGNVIGFVSLDESIGSQVGVPVTEAIKLIDAVKALPAARKAQ